MKFFNSPIFQYPYVMITIFVFVFIVMGLVGLYFMMKSVRTSKGTVAKNFCALSKIENDFVKAVYKNPAFSESQTTIHIVANKVMSLDDGRIVYEKLKSVVERFLNGKVNYLGMVPADMVLEKAVRAQKTVSLFDPKANSAKAYEILAKNLMEGTHEQVQIRRGIGQMFSNLLNRRK